jgi:hypothetical protein
VTLSINTRSLDPKFILLSPSSPPQSSFPLLTHTSHICQSHTTLHRTTPLCLAPCLPPYPPHRRSEELPSDHCPHTGSRVLLCGAHSNGYILSRWLCGVPHIPWYVGVKFENYNSSRLVLMCYCTVLFVLFFTFFRCKIYCTLLCLDALYCTVPYRPTLHRSELCYTSLHCLLYRCCQQ